MTGRGRILVIINEDTHIIIEIEKEQLKKGVVEESTQIQSRVSLLPRRLQVDLLYLNQDQDLETEIDAISKLALRHLHPKNKGRILILDPPIPRNYLKILTMKIFPKKISNILEKHQVNYHIYNFNH